MISYQQKISKLKALPRIPLQDIFICGIEREAMRVDKQGVIAASGHPKSLGLALTNDYITTDFAESLLELVTPPFSDTNKLVSFLKSLHSFTATNLGDERLWPASMPPILPDPENFNIAEYGDSCQGKLRHIYRRGLSIRYGRRMQAIAGVHFNFSLSPQFQEYYCKMSDETLNTSTNAGANENKHCRNALYLNILRNYIRNSWLINYLFGSSPAIDKSFVQGQEIPDFLQPLGKSSFYNDKSTCLRMGSLGYNNRKQVELNVCFNNIEEYISTIKRLTAKPDDQYVAMGLKDAQGEYQQLNTNLLQIENEYYAPIRPKAVRRHDQKTLDALMESGTEYLEIRNLDIDPFSPWGIDEECIRFMQLFLLYLSLEPSPPISREECQAIRKLEDTIVTANLEADKDFPFIGDSILNISDRAESMLTNMQPLAEYLDSCDESGANSYSQALSKQREAIDNEELLPAVRQLDFLKKSRGADMAINDGDIEGGVIEGGIIEGSFIDAMNDLAQQHQQAYMEYSQGATYQEFVGDFDKQVENSRKIEQRILAEQNGDQSAHQSMDEVIANYLK